MVALSKNVWVLFGSRMNANASEPVFWKEYVHPSVVAEQDGSEIVIFPESVPISTVLCVWSRVVFAVMAVIVPSTTPTAFTAACDAPAVAFTPALAVVRPETVNVPVFVLFPAHVCVPVETTPLNDASASGIFKFIAEPERANPIAADVVVIPSV